MDKLLLITGGALFAFALFGVETNEPEAAPPIAIADIRPAPPPPRAGNGSARVALPRASDGHFYADVRINGATVRMLVDTGASAVVLTRGDAQRAGIQARPGEFTATGRTIGGDVALKPVTIARVAIGPVASRDVPAMVAEADLPVSLLGQSFLERVGTVEIDGDELRLR